MHEAKASLLRLTALLAALVAGGCLFDRTVPEGPSPLPGFHGVQVRIQYTQPRGCLNSAGRCADPVVFFGSWMRPGGEAALAVGSGTYVWTGTVASVPVNYPPREEPYLVRVYDPYLFDTPSGGVTAARLIIGGQVLSTIDSAGTPAESGLVYVDDNGGGHNPY